MPPGAPNPRRPVLVFDGDCGFCTRSARWIERRLGGRAAVEPGQRLDLPALGLTEADVDDAAWWIDERGRRHRGHRAIARALIAAGRGWPLLGWPMLVPPSSWLAALVYRWIARNRYRMPGGTPACAVPDPTASAGKPVP